MRRRWRNKEKSKEFNYEKYRLELVFFLCCAGLIVIFVIWLSTIRVDVEAQFRCNSGEIDLDYTAHNNIQNYTSEDPFSIIEPCPKGMVCFKQKLLAKDLTLYGIDSLEFEGSTKLSVPYIYVLGGFE